MTLIFVNQFFLHNNINQLTRHITITLIRTVFCCYTKYKYSKSYETNKQQMTAIKVIYLRNQKCN